jgi:hypothetical protein
MDNDGQLLVISGFIMAMGLVVLAVMLNSIIYTNNSAYEGSMDTNNKNILYINDLTSRESYNAYYNAPNPTDSTKYNTYMNEYSKALKQLYAYKGVSVSITTQPCDYGNKKTYTQIKYSDGDITSDYTLTAYVTGP